MEYRLKAMDLWYRELPGSLLLEQEQQQIGSLLSHIYGNHLLQIGGPAHEDMAKVSPISHRVYLSSQALFNRRPAIQADLLHLPLIPNSIDAVLLVHALEFVSDPRAVLAEIYQGLAANAQLLLLGFNPWSLWGVSRLSRGKKGYPWAGQFWSMSRIKSDLRAVGFNIIASKTFFFCGPSNDTDRLRQRLFLEALGQFCLPGCGGVYLIASQKKSLGVTPLKESWWAKKPTVSNGYAEPSTRSLYDEF